MKASEEPGKLENGESTIENGGSMGDYLPVSNFHFPASRLTLPRANCYISMRLWQDLEASEEWQTF
jgi:hypothetical protein